MRKGIMCCLGLLMMASVAFGEPFSPTPMDLRATSWIQYAFGGANLNVDFTANCPGNYFFLVFTKDKASTIGNNHDVAWHQVNGIDTCLYASSMQTLNSGQNSFSWTGRNDDGNVVATDDYTYYIWAVDTSSPRTLALSRTSFTVSAMPQNWREIVTKDSAGVDLAKPLLYFGDQNRSSANTAETVHTNTKWEIGNDPNDASFTERCNTLHPFDSGALFIDAAHPGTFYKAVQRLVSGGGGIEVRKYGWVSNGTATRYDESWGNGYEGMPGAFWYLTSHTDRWFLGDIASDGEYLWTLDADEVGAPDHADLIAITLADGLEDKRISLADWWMSDQDSKNGGQICGGPFNMEFRDGRLSLGAHTSCVNQVVNPYAENDTDAFFWTNLNGDGIGDKNGGEAPLHPGVCQDKAVSPYKYNMSSDANGFAVFPCYDYDTSFGLYAPDGTGLAYVKLNAETAGTKNFTEVIDSGSQYDGVYTSEPNYTTTATTFSFYHTPQSSIKGVISPNPPPFVNTATPATFTVSQNSPNPFNPTTTITFKLMKEGKTTVEVFNAAGQKVDTIVNSNLRAGSHSVTWNAAKFSAGVYFYTVKSGSFSKTMKMTLLK